MIYQDQDNRIGENLRRLREGCGFSQKQVADAVHIDRSTYTNYELGKICTNGHIVRWEMCPRR